MKSKVSIFIIVCFFSALLVFAALKSFSSDSKNASEYIQPNEEVVNFKDFYVSSDSTELNSSARGTIFVEKDKSNNYTAQIVAWIEVDPMDWCGVEFTIPFGWEVTNMMSSYPNIGNNTWMSCPFENDPVEVDRDPLNWRQLITIGNKDYLPSISSSGGSGSVIIELAAYPKGQQPTETLIILVGVGSDESDEIVVFEMCDEEVCDDITQEGYGIQYPDFELIEVPIIQYDQ